MSATRRVMCSVPRTALLLMLALTLGGCAPSGPLYGVVDVARVDAPPSVVVQAADTADDADDTYITPDVAVLLVADVQKEDRKEDHAQEAPVQAWSQTQESTLSRAIMTSRTIDLLEPPVDLWERIRRGFAIPDLADAYTLRWTRRYADDAQTMQRILTRASRYLYYIVEEIEQRGLPTELALLPFVESAFNPTAYSRAHASGLWQFIPSTGLQYKLEQDKWRDLRRDPIASTQAALDYLEYLYETQGDWYLALASYNWGEGAVRRALQRNTQRGLGTDYVTLRMPAETRHYLPKLQAIKNLISNPDQYGLTLPVIENEPYFTTISDIPTLSIFDAAKLAEMPLEEFKALNASFNHPIMLAEHKPTLLLPTDKARVFQNNLQNRRHDLPQWKTYRAKAGESYSAIAKKYGLTLSNLRKLNGLPSNQIKAPRASLLVLPADPRKPIDLRVTQFEPVPALQTHVVKTGDTLYALAIRYRTTVANLRKLNSLTSSLLRPGARLRVPARRQG